MTINIILLSLMNYYWFGLPSLIGRGLVFPGLKFLRHFISCSIFVFAVKTTFNFRELFFVENSTRLVLTAVYLLFSWSTHKSVRSLLQLLTTLVHLVLN